MGWTLAVDSLVLCWLYDHVNGCLNAAALLSGLELTVTQQRTGQAHLIPGPAEWTLWILSNFTHSSVLLHHLFFSIHHCVYLCFSFITSLSVLLLLLSLPVSHSPFFLCDAAAPFCSEAAKIAQQAVLGSHPSLFCFPVSGGFFSVFLHIQHLFSLAPTGPNWPY